MGTVRLAADDVDVFVRGELLSAGLIAEGGGIMSCEASSLRHTGRLLFSPQKWVPLSAISRLYQI